MRTPIEYSSIAQPQGEALAERMRPTSPQVSVLLSLNSVPAQNVPADEGNCQTHPASEDALRQSCTRGPGSVSRRKWVLTGTAYRV